jgi:hypothetical protein
MVQEVDARLPHPSDRTSEKPALASNASRTAKILALTSRQQQTRSPFVERVTSAEPRGPPAATPYCRRQRHFLTLSTRGVIHFVLFLDHLSPIHTITHSGNGASSMSEAPVPSATDIEPWLSPVAVEHPAGESLRYEGTYDRIQEARREDDPHLPQGVWQATLPAPCGRDAPGRGWAKPRPRACSVRALSNATPCGPRWSHIYLPYHRHTSMDIDTDCNRLPCTHHMIRRKELER